MKAQKTQRSNSRNEALIEAGMAALVRAVTEESAYTRVIFRVKPDEIVRYQAKLVDLSESR